MPKPTFFSKATQFSRIEPRHFTHYSQTPLAEVVSLFRLPLEMVFHVTNDTAAFSRIG